MTAFSTHPVRSDGDVYRGEYIAEHGRLVCISREHGHSRLQCSWAQWGFAFLVSSAVGGVMVAHGSHTVAVGCGPGLPLLTWSRITAIYVGRTFIDHDAGASVAGYFLQKKSWYGLFAAMLAIFASVLSRLQGRLAADVVTRSRTHSLGNSLRLRNVTGVS